jgi:hypothetical protein
MLVIQIALGIVLAVVILRFWRQSLWIAGGLAALVLLLIGWLWISEGHHWEDALLSLGTLAVLVPLAWWARTLPRTRKEHRSRSVQNGPPP